MIKLFAVLAITSDPDETDSAIFQRIFRHKKEAMQAIEEDALEHWNMLVDPNSGDRQKFPGLHWSDDENTAAFDLFSEATLSYEITEVELD